MSNIGEFYIADTIEKMIGVRYGNMHGNVNTMTYTQAQAQMLLGNAMMYVCGDWLENEMKAQKGNGETLKYMKTPIISGIKHTHHIILITLSLLILCKLSYYTINNFINPQAPSEQFGNSFCYSARLNFSVISVAVVTVFAQIIASEVRFNSEKPDARLFRLYKDKQGVLAYRSDVEIKFVNNNLTPLYRRSASRPYGSKTSQMRRVG